MTSIPRLKSRGPIEAVPTPQRTRSLLSIPRLKSRGPIEATLQQIVQLWMQTFRG